MRNAFLIATDLDNAAHELRHALPKLTSDETPEQFRLRMATAKATRAMEEAARELRGESEAFEAQRESLFARLSD